MKTLVSNFTHLNNVLEKLLSTSQTLSLHLKNRDQTAFEEEKRREALLLHDFQKTNHVFQQALMSASEIYQCEATVLSLVRFADDETKEKLMACRGRAIHYEQELKNITKQNERLMYARYQSEKIILESVQHVQAQNGKGASLFHKKF